MRDDELATAALRRLPPDVVAGIREAFAAEVAERLPRLRSAVESADLDLLPEAIRDAHALGSSAAVVGEPDASRAARVAEALLLDGQESGDAAAMSTARAPVAELQQRLAGWSP